MMSRCNNPKNYKFDRYGGRGIKVCERWHTFENFLTDMVEVPSARHSLDRIDNDGPYSPENCRWATLAQQARNNSRNRFYTHDGKTMCLRDWATHLSMSPNTLRYRLARGYAFEDAIKRDLPPQKKDGNNEKPRGVARRLITFNGVTQSLSAWARYLGVNTASLSRRLRDWPLDRALTLPPGIKTESKSAHPLVFNGETLTICDWSRKTGIPQPTISGRLRRGWSVERALTKKP